MKLVSSDRVVFLLNQINFYELRKQLTMQAMDILPDISDKSYSVEFRIEVLGQRIQLVTEMLEITEMLVKLETALKEVLP